MLQQHLTTGGTGVPEPPIATILIQTPFLLASNVLNHVLNPLLYADSSGRYSSVQHGALRAPGLRHLPREVELAMVPLDHIGISLVVFEARAWSVSSGGLSLTRSHQQVSRWIFTP